MIPDTAHAPSSIRAPAQRVGLRGGTDGTTHEGGQDKLGGIGTRHGSAHLGRKPQTDCHLLTVRTVPGTREGFANTLSSICSKENSKPARVRNQSLCTAAESKAPGWGVTGLERKAARGRTQTPGRLVRLAPEPTLLQGPSQACAHGLAHGSTR